MKSLKVLSIAALLLAGFAASELKAEQYNVNVATNIPTLGALDFSGGGFPNISGGAKLKSITLSNNGTVGYVRLWKNCTAHTAAQFYGEYVVKASETITIPLDTTGKSKVSNLCIGGRLVPSATVNATIIYE